MERISCSDDRVDEIPEFCLLEVLIFHGFAVIDFVTEKVGVVVVLDLDRGNFT